MRQRLFEVDDWHIKTSELNKEDRRLAESLTSIGNGYMGMRGNFEEGYSGDSHQGTYLAGVWYPDKTRVGWWKNGYPDYFGKVINALNFIGIGIEINGSKLDLYTDEVQSFEQNLDMKHGILSRRFTVIKDKARYLVETERLLSIAVPELALIHYAITPLDGDAEILFVPFLDGNVHNEDANYEEMFWEARGEGSKAGMEFLTTETIPNDFGIERFRVHALQATEMVGNILEVSENQHALYAEKRLLVQAKQAEMVSLEKRVVITTSRDGADLAERAEGSWRVKERKITEQCGRNIPKLGKLAGKKQML
ncbi:maltose phosphorylase [Listeria floridensis FSL S10-1187]|uniref:Maltose phosphorylase n=1 Tax=Listeria floridensis FSL S10-1187 TaxID=1265817 RepID=A0ABN0RFD7_9LIST|nr:maltose phosphorylase [Listeria floridensis FSL S10-1187]